MSLMKLREFAKKEIEHKIESQKASTSRLAFLVREIAETSTDCIQNSRVDTRKLSNFLRSEPAGQKKIFFRANIDSKKRKD